MPILISGSDFVTTCGNFVFEVTNPDADIFDITLPTVTDGTEAIKVVVKETSDVVKVPLSSPYERDYSFLLTIKLVNW